MLRGERDKRFYAKLFARGQQVGAWRRMWLLATCPKVDISDLQATMRSAPQPGMVVVFRNRLSGNEAAHFHEIVGRSDLVRNRLVAMTRDRYRPTPIRYPHVAIHVRGGDFGNSGSIDALLSGAHNQRLPVHWFVEMLEGLRQRLVMAVPAVVYSDCGDTELEELLDLPDTRRAPRSESITDMLAMSQASLQLSSGSGFSRWGAYLGGVPRICFPGQRHVRVLAHADHRGLELEPEAMHASELRDDFVAFIRHRLLEAQEKSVS